MARSSPFQTWRAPKGGPRRYWLASPVLGSTEPSQGGDEISRNAYRPINQRPSQGIVSDLSLRAKIGARSHSMTNRTGSWATRPR
jgi:hypothetical protein